VRFEPTLDKARLRELLRDQYGLDMAGLTFVPFGIDSWSYVADGLDGSRAFVKLLRPLPGAEAAASEIPLIAALAAGLVPVPRPIARRDGVFPSTFEGFEVQVFEYIAGHNLEDESAWPDELYGRVAETAAAVHASTSRIRHLVRRIEDYQLPFLRSLVGTVAAIESGGALPAGDDPTLGRLRELVAPRVSELRRAFGRLEELRDLARERDTDEVLCHTDIWGSNLIQAEDGTLYLLDWNGALLGPPERDLFMFAGTVFFPAARFGWFLERYEAAFRPVRLDARAFGFYFYRRNIEDLAALVASIAEGRTDALGPTEALAIVERLIASFPRIEGRIGRVAEALDLAGYG
jgi:spectinomycin phosphotransferase